MIPPISPQTGAEQPISILIADLAVTTIMILGGGTIPFILVGVGAAGVITLGGTTHGGITGHFIHLIIVHHTIITLIIILIIILIITDILINHIITARTGLLRHSIQQRGVIQTAGQAAT